MIKALLGRKLDQIQKFDQAGKRVPVTRVVVEPNFIIDKIVDGNGRRSIKIGGGIFTKPKNLNKPHLGILKKAGLNLTHPRFFREFQSEIDESIKPGQQIKVDEVFTVGDKVAVTGLSKGKGFAGVVKRHHFRGGPKTHGQSDRLRAPGSIGQTTTPGRVYKGKRMAGRMGGEKVTVKGLSVFEVFPEENLLLVKGLVPGRRKSLLVIRKILN